MTQQQWFAAVARWLRQRAQQVASRRVDLECERRKVRARIGQQRRDWRGRWCR